MKYLFPCLMLMVLEVTACTTKSKADAQAQAAYAAGQQRALTAMPNQPPTVTFRGDVRNPVVPWTEDLSLAAALLAAEYTALWDPHSISITRQGQTFRVNPRHFLSGAENPLLEPGDIVEVRR